MNTEKAVKLNQCVYFYFVGFSLLPNLLETCWNQSSYAASAIEYFSKIMFARWFHVARKILFTEDIEL